MHLRFVAATFATFTVLLAADITQAQRPSRYPTITDPAQAGPDFQLQGEYAGWAYTPGRASQWVGLQVISGGDGKFDAVAYRGGLPGNGWNRVTKKKLTGQVGDGRLLLTGPEDRLVVGGGVAVAVDDSGRELWRLVKMLRTSATMGQPPPANAIVLFDGRSTDQFQPGAKISEDGLLMAGVMTKMPVQAFHMQLEFRTP